jgi:hypothetical protein
MQWNRIFENARLISEFAKVSRDQKKILLVAYLYRQRRLLECFGSCYGEKLTITFLNGLESILAADEININTMLGEVQGNIPDTDEFSGQEGAYAQNLMIALMYLLSFCQSGDQDQISKCINSALNNIDLINYERDEGYDESKVVEQEVAAVERSLSMLAVDRVDKLYTSENLASIAGEML